MRDRDMLLAFALVTACFVGGMMALGELRKKHKERGITR